MWADLTVWDSAAIAAKLFVYIGSFLAMGSVIFALANPGLDQPLTQTLKRATVVGALITIGGSIAQFLVQCGSLLDEGLSGMVDPDMLELVSGGPLGEAVALRILGAILLCAFAVPMPFARFAAGLGAAAIAISFSRVGHGTEEPRWLLGTLVSLHVLAAAFWIGAFLPLHRAAGAHKDAVAAGQLAHRFGQQAAYVVAALVAMGLLLAWWFVETPANLIQSQYGFTLLVKLIVVAGLLGLGAVNKLRFVPDMISGSSTAAKHLRSSIVLETIAIAVILIVTAVLTTTTSLPAMEGPVEGGSSMEGMDHSN